MVRTGNFSEKKTIQSEQDLNLTGPVLARCCNCGFELPKDAESNRGFFVYSLVCRDVNNGNKIVHGAPGMFMQTVNNVKGSSASSCQLKENYTFVRWHILCVRCYANKTMHQDLTKKTNNLKSTGKSEPLDIHTALKRLREKQNVRHELR